MALANAYVLPINRISELFQRIKDGQAPERFTIQLLKDWGFKSTNDRAFIPLLKAVGFLTADGKPTSRYLEYRDHSKSKQVLGQSIREAYSDLFLIKDPPTTSDRISIQGKFKSFHNTSDNVADQMTKTFLALLPLADLSSKNAIATVSAHEVPAQAEAPKADNRTVPIHAHGLHYNIQIHLPATKDVEVYNSIFKSLKEHLLDH